MQKNKFFLLIINSAKSYYLHSCFSLKNEMHVESTEGRTSLRPNFAGFSYCAHLASRKILKTESFLENRSFEALTVCL